MDIQCVRCDLPLKELYQKKVILRFFNELDADFEDSIALAPTLRVRSLNRINRLDRIDITGRMPGKASKRSLDYDHQS